MNKLYKALLVTLLVAIVVTGATFIIAPTHVHADTATLYWYGGTGNWSSGTSHWSTNSGNSPSAPHVSPTATNNVIFDANSFSADGQYVMVDNVAASCADMDWSAIGYVNSLGFSGTSSLSIYGSLTKSALMTWSTTVNSLTFKATSGPKTITSNGIPYSGVVMFDGVGGSWQLQDDFIEGTQTLNLYVKNGILDTNGKTVTTGAFLMNQGGTNTLTLGSSVINCRAWDAVNLGTLNAGTSTINDTLDTSSTFGGSSKTYNNVTLSGVASAVVVSGTNTFNVLTVGCGSGSTGSATLSSANTFTNLTVTNGWKNAVLYLGANQTVTGTFTAAGISSTNRLGVASGTAVQRTISAAVVVSSHVDYYYIIGAGAGDWDLSSGGEDSIDYGNNTGITFTWPYSSTDDMYWTGLQDGIGGSGYWTSESGIGINDYNWSTTSGGVGGSSRHCSPNSTNNVFFDAGSGFTIGNNDITRPSSGASAVLRAKNVDFTGSSIAPDWQLSGSSGGAGDFDFYLYGSLTLVSGMTIYDSFPYYSPDANFHCTGSGTITSASVVIDIRAFVVEATADYILQDDLHITTNFTRDGGVFDTNGHDIHIVGEAGVNGVVFTGGTSNTYYSLTMNAVGTLTVTGTNTFTNLTRTGTNVFTDAITFAANQVITGTLTLTGYDSSHRLQFRSSVTATQRQVTVNGSCAITNTDIQDSAKVGSASPDISAGNNSDLGNNLGWIFTVAGDVYWVGNSGNWSDISHWAATPGGAGGYRVPLIQDTAIFDSFSTTIPGRTITIDVTNLSGIDTTAATYNPTISKAGTVDIYGGIAWGSATWSVTTTNMKGFQTASLSTLGTGGGFTTAFHVLKTESVMASCVLASDFVVIGTVYVDSGVLSLSSHTLTATSFDSVTTTYNRAVTGGTGTFLLTGTGVINKWNVASSKLTFTAGDSLIVFSNSGVSTQTFVGAGLTYNDFTITGAGVYQTTVSGTNTFGDVTIDRSIAAKTLAGAVTMTVANLYSPPNGTVQVTITSTDFTKASGSVTLSYMTISGSAAAGGATFLAGTAPPSVDGGSNSGWVFIDAAGCTVSSSAATLLTLVGGTVNGELTNMGSYTGATVYLFFQYGPTPAYGNTTTEQSVTALTLFHADLVGLSSDTLYYYRAAVRYNSTMYAYGAQLNFTTLGAPIITTLPAANVAPTTVTLQASLNMVAYPSVYAGFEYGLTTSYGHSTAYQTFTTSSNVVEDLTGLAQSTTYHYRAVVVYAGITAYGADVAFTTTGTGSVTPGTGANPPDILAVVDAKVISGYLETGDQMYLVSYKCIYTAGTPNLPASEFFVIQLLNNSSIVGQWALPDWGYQPVGLYLGPSSTLPYGGSYTIRIIGIASKWTAPIPSASRVLSAGDWLGTDLNQLDNWVITTAQSIGTYYDVELVTNIASGIVLNSDGGALFNQNISGLSSVRPMLFSTYAYRPHPNYTPTTTTTYVDTWNTSTNLGPYINSLLQDGATAMEMEQDPFNNFIGITLWSIVTVALLLAFKGSYMAPVISTPMLVGVAWVGLLTPTVIVVLAVLCVALLTYSLLPRGTG